MSMTNRQWLLNSRAAGEPTSENFKLIEVEVPDLQDGEVLVRHRYLSLDPYMRGRMTDAKNYATLQPLAEVMIGGTVGEVAASKNPAFAVGDPGGGECGQGCGGRHRRPASQGSRCAFSRLRRRPRQMPVRDGGARLRRLHRLQAAPGPEVAVAGGEGGVSRRPRRAL